MTKLIEWIGDRWCELFHHGVMWPLNGGYRCKKCLRLWQVGW